MEDQNQVVFLVTLVRKDLRHDGWGDVPLKTEKNHEYTSLRVCYIKVRWSYDTFGLCCVC